MSILEQIIRQLEDFVLAEHGLYGAGRIPFEHVGDTAYGFPYIRSAGRPFEQALLASLELLPAREEPYRFLEVGCGLGTKCEMARFCGLDACGIDIKPEYVRLAAEIFPECEFAQANALEFDYSPFDLVFYHIPLVDDQLLFQLERRVLSQLRRDRVLFLTRLSDQLSQRLTDSHRSSLAAQPPLELSQVPDTRLTLLQKRGVLEDAFWQA